MVGVSVQDAYKADQNTVQYMYYTYTKLGTLQVSQNANGVRILFFNLANDEQELFFLLLRAVRKVEAKHVRAREKELFNHLLAGRGRPERCHLFGRLAPALCDHGGRRDRCC